MTTQPQPPHLGVSPNWAFLPFDELPPALQQRVLAAIEAAKAPPE